MYQKKLWIIQEKFSKSLNDHTDFGADFGMDCDCNFNRMARGKWPEGDSTTQTALKPDLK